jgi:ParB-like chromosome segregation protein Spo0J
MEIRDRIRELRRVKASNLIPNPKNWRRHPRAQADALRGLLAEVGYADALLARELPDGKLMLIDGHLRAETTPDSEVPVLVLDVSEDEADKILLTLDPLASLAQADSERVQALLESVRTDSDGVAALLETIAKQAAEVSGNYRKLQADTESVPEPPAQAITKPGDLWLLGEAPVAMRRCDGSG